LPFFVGREQITVFVEIADDGMARQPNRRLNRSETEQPREVIRE
jgi:hypothetical protein